MGVIGTLGGIGGKMNSTIREKVRHRVHEALDHQCHAARTYFKTENGLSPFPPTVKWGHGILPILPVNGIYKLKHKSHHISFRVDRLRRVYLEGG